MMPTRPGEDEDVLRAKEAWEIICHQLGATLVGWLKNPDCAEIMANPDGSVWVETHSRGMFRLELELSAAARRQIIQTVASAANKVCHEDEPEVGDILPVVGARFQGLIEPASFAPAFTIRLPSQHLIPLEEYLASGALSEDQARVLTQGIHQRKNILIAGGTGSGKTTFANALLAVIATTNHRIMTIEDTPELRCEAPNTIPVYVNRQGHFRYRDALFVALRLRPDRIIVGELRDGRSALELLKAWNTGHNGGMATLHANSSRAALPRLEQLLAEEVARIPRALIAEAIDLIVFLERYTHPEGHSARRVRDVARVRDQLDPRGGYVLDHLVHPSLRTRST